METITAKRKTFNIIEKLSDNSFKVERKGKFYFLKQLSLEDQSFDTWFNKYKRLKVAGIMIPKVRIIDKKTGIYVSDFVNGTRVLDALIKDDLDEKYYQLVFINGFYEKQERFNLNYQPENWLMGEDGKLYYMSFEYTDKYVPENSFEKKGIFYWFYTRQFADYLNTKGIEVDKTRLKNEYETNKKILMIVVKYHL